MSFYSPPPKKLFSFAESKCLYLRREQLGFKGHGHIALVRIYTVSLLRQGYEIISLDPETTAELKDASFHAPSGNSDLHNHCFECAFTPIRCDETLQTGI